MTLKKILSYRDFVFQEVLELLYEHSRWHMLQKIFFNLPIWSLNSRETRIIKFIL